MRPESETQLTFAARLPVKSGPPQQFASHRLGILIRINDDPRVERVRFSFLAEHYLKADFGTDAVRPKSENTTSTVEHIVRDYLIARWSGEIAEDIKPLDIQRWLKALNTESKLAWPTISKMRGVMSRIYKVGILHERITNNPVLHVETRRNQLPGYRHYPCPDVQHSEIPGKQSSSLAGAHLRGDRTPLVGDFGAALG